MLRVLAAELSDPGRYSRAKAYARDGAVIEIDVQPEAASGLVMGSRRDPYEVVLAVDPVPAHEIEGADPDSVALMTMLIPGRDELAVSCTCPDADGGQLCKHALALLLVLADEVSLEPELLIRWRTGAAGVGPRWEAFRLAPRARVTAALAPGQPARHRAAPGRTPAPSTAATAATPPVPRLDPLAGLLGATGELPVLPTIAPHPLASPPAVALNDPAARLLHELTVSALGAVTGRR